jgi:Ca2+-binding EF-hand superfamily protein
MNNEEYAEKMINDLDLNNDGLIDEEEFIEGVLKNENYTDLVRFIKPAF